MGTASQTYDEAGRLTSLSVAGDTQRMNRAIDPEAPKPREREPSGLARLAGVAMDRAMADHLDAKARASLRGLVEEVADDAARAAVDAYKDAAKRHDSGPELRRSALPWAVAFAALALTLGVCLVVGGFTLAHVKGRQDERLEYDRAQAQWLVVQSRANYEAHVATDKILRRLAKRENIDVADVDSPREIVPPAIVQRRALETE